MFRIHSLVLICASSFYYDIIENSKSLSQKMELPLRVILESNNDLNEKNYKEAFDLVLDFMYSNQDFKEIKSKIEKKFLYTLLSLAHAMRIEKLRRKLIKYIRKKVLSEKNCVFNYFVGFLVNIFN